MTCSPASVLIPHLQTYSSMRRGDHAPRVYTQPQVHGQRRAPLYRKTKKQGTQGIFDQPQRRRGIERHRAEWARRALRRIARIGHSRT